MISSNTLKILIVGLTTVLSLIKFNNNAFQKEIAQNNIERRDLDFQIEKK